MYSTFATSRASHKRVRKVVGEHKDTLASTRQQEIVFPAYLNVYCYGPAKERSLKLDLKVSKAVEGALVVDDIKAEITCMVYDERQKSNGKGNRVEAPPKSLYLATKRGHVFIFQ